MPKRIQMSRQHPWRADNPDAVIVARPSRWGNPFRLQGRSVVGLPWFYLRGRRLADAARRPPESAGVFEVIYSSHSSVESARADAVDVFRSFCHVNRRDYPDEFEEWIAPLRGQDLACWCPLDEPCHGDVYLELANGNAS